MDSGTLRSTWTTAAAAPARSSGSIEAVRGIKFRLTGKLAIRALISSAASPSAPLRYRWTTASRLCARQLLAVSLGLITDMSCKSSVRNRADAVFKGQGGLEV